MYYNDYFKGFSDDSRVWIYPSSRALSAAETTEITEALVNFCDEWTAHDKKLRAAGEILHQRFIVLMVDESRAGASGCSIDASVRFIQNLENKYDISLLDRLTLGCRTHAGIRLLNKAGVLAGLDAGEINLETPVFNNLVTRKAQWVSEWEIPLKMSWVARFVKQPAGR